MNAADPVNLVGLVVPGESVTAIRTNRVVYVDGLPETADATASRSAPDGHRVRENDPVYGRAS